MGIAAFSSARIEVGEVVAPSSLRIGIQTCRIHLIDRIVIYIRIERDAFGVIGE